ncbi:MAG: hypothetical protein KGZ93_05735 [Actinobacteria bacterium]|nr:hypothetical protein [Actinomycetota bacterium]
MDKPTLEVLKRVEEAATDKRISCTVARKVAEDLGVPARMVGDACDELGVKIHACELGCFK